MNETIPVLALMGLPGAGKSRLAKSLCQSGNWQVLDRDRIRAELMSEGLSLAAGKQAAEAQMAERLRQYQGSQGLIIDGMTLARREQRARWQGLCRGAGLAWQLVYLACPVDLAVQRVVRDREQGHHPAGDRDAELVRRVAARLEAPLQEERMIHLSAEHSTEHQRRLLIRKLNGAGIS